MSKPALLSRSLLLKAQRLRVADPGVPSGGGVNSSAMTNAVGTIVAIQGSVVDVRFEAQLPAINHMLLSGDKDEVIIEVAALIGPHTVRGLIFNVQHGLALGMPTTNP